MGRWAQLHIARADLLARLHRNRDAVGAYMLALELEPPLDERVFIGDRIRKLSSHT
jgi:RNA polymerase sigma-70 factor, ECF subfamily